MSSERIERLIGVHQERLVRYVKNISRLIHDADARAIVNEAAFEVYRRLPRIADGAEAAYAYRTAQSRAINFILHQQTGAHDWRREVGIDEAANEPDPAPPADELLIREERRVRMQQAIAELPELTRLCLLADLDGQSSDEIAKKLGMKSGTVRSRISRAKEQLRKQFEEDVHDLRK